MPTYYIQMGQAAIVDRSASHENGLYTGAAIGAEAGETIQSCSAVVMPSPDQKRVALYHFPAGALKKGPDQATTKNVIAALIELAKPKAVWIYWGWVRDPHSVKPPPPIKPSDQYHTGVNRDVDEIVKVIKELDKDIVVHPPGSNDATAIDYAAKKGYVWAHIPVGKDIVREYEYYFHHTSTMLDARDWNPGRAQGEFLCVANTQRFAGLIKKAPDGAAGSAAGGGASSSSGS